MLAHHTVSGCSMEVGDLIGSGTISGTGRNGQGSLLEQTNGGKDMVTVGHEQRKFLEDGDTIVLRGFCRSETKSLGFGECTGRIDMAKPLQ